MFRHFNRIENIIDKYIKPLKYASMIRSLSLVLLFRIIVRCVLSNNHNSSSLFWLKCSCIDIDIRVGVLVLAFYSYVDLSSLSTSTCHNRSSFQIHYFTHVDLLSIRSSLQCNDDKSRRRRMKIYSLVTRWENHLHKLSGSSSSSFSSAIVVVIVKKTMICRWSSSSTPDRIHFKVTSSLSFHL